MTDGITASIRIDERIDTLDVLRGIAISGILLMNIPIMGLIGEPSLPPFPARWNTDWIAVAVQRLLFDGTMRGLFTMLFGVGMLLMLRRTFSDSPQITPIDVWTRRCLALMGLGVLQWAVFMWPGEILWNYGLCGFILLAFRTARPRTLLVSAAIALLAFGTLWAWQKADAVDALRAGIPAAAARAAGTPLTAEQHKIVIPLDEAREMLQPTPAAIAKEQHERSHPASLLAWSWKMWSGYNLAVDSWIWLFESLGFMLTGMALYRTGVLTGTAPPHVYIRLMLICYPLGLALRAYAFRAGLSSDFDLDVTKIDAAQSVARALIYQPARLLVTLGHIGLIVTLFRSGAFGRAWPLRAMGRMALTVYTLQSILTSILFYGLGYVGAFGFAALMGIAVVIWIITGVFCVVWLRHHEMGPAERLLRVVSYAGFGRRREAAAMVPAATTAV